MLPSGGEPAIVVVKKPVGDSVSVDDEQKAEGFK